MCPVQLTTIHCIVVPLLCADRPFVPSVTKSIVKNWERFRLTWDVRWNPLCNTTYTAWFSNRYVTKYYGVSVDCRLFAIVVDKFELLCKASKKSDEICHFMFRYYFCFDIYFCLLLIRFVVYVSFIVVFTVIY